MRYSFATVSVAALAATTMAAPAHQKRDAGVLTETITVVVTEYVTATPAATSTATPTDVEVQEVTPSSDNYFNWGNWWGGNSDASASTIVITPSNALPITSAVEEATTTPEAVAVTSEAVAATTTSSAAVATSSSTDSSLESQALTAHNEKRALHGAPDLAWNTAMATFASGVSGTCVFEHSGGPYGENLAAGYDTPAAAIEAWYDEGSSYDYAAGEFSETTGHFTQVVWKSATQVGCAIVTCDGANGTPGQFLTCNYDTGNVIGEFVENVLPLGTAVSE